MQLLYFILIITKLFYSAYPLGKSPRVEKFKDLSERNARKKRIQELTYWWEGHVSFVIKTELLNQELTYCWNQDTIWTREYNQEGKH